MCIARRKEPLSREDIAADKNKRMILQQQCHTVTIDGDGNCFHRAVSQHIYGNEENHKLTRDKICDHIRDNKKAFRDLVLGESGSFDECLLARRQDRKCADLIDVAAAIHAFKRSFRMFSIVDPGEGVKHGPCEDEILMFRRHPNNDVWCHCDLLITKATQVAKPEKTGEVGDRASVETINPLPSVALTSAQEIVASVDLLKMCTALKATGLLSCL